MNIHNRIKHRYIYLLIIGSNTGSAVAHAVRGDWMVAVPYVASVMAWCAVLWLDFRADALLNENRRLRNLLAQSNVKTTVRKNQYAKFTIYQN